MCVKNKVLFKKIFLFFMVCLFWLSIAEVTLCFLSDRLNLNWGWRWDESPYRSAENISDHRVNQLGLRGREISYTDDDIVILLVGDSYVEAGTQRFEDMPEFILEQALQEQYGSKNIRVFSVASAGWGQDQQLLWLKQYFKNYRADLVVAWLTPVNDFWENTFVERSVSTSFGRLKPSFRLVGGYLEGPKQSYTHSYILDLIVRAKANLEGAESKLLEQEVTYWNSQLPSASRKIQPVSCPDKVVAQAEVISALRENHGDITVKTSEDIEGNRSHFSPFGIPRSMREQYQIDITKALLERMKSEVETVDGKFAVFYPYGSELDLAMSHVKCIRSDSSEIVYAIDMKDVLVELKKLSQINFITPRIVSSQPTMISSVDWHLNRLGNELAMKGLANLLMERKFLK